MTARKQPTLKLTEAQVVTHVRNLGVPDWIGEYMLLAVWLACILKATQWMFWMTTILLEVAIYEANRASQWLVTQMNNPTVELWSVVAWYAVAGSVIVFAFETWRQGRDLRV